MKRRDFVKATATGGTAAAIGVPAFLPSRPKLPADGAFNLKYAPHFGMFRHHAGNDKLDQLRFMAEVGFRAFEHNGMRDESARMQERIGEELARLGMTMGVFVANDIQWSKPDLASGQEDHVEAFLKSLRASVEVAKRCGATWMTVVPGHVELRLDPHYQMANVVEALRRGAEILEPHGLVMVLEPLNWHVDHPGQFLQGSPQAYMVCRAVDSPAVKILFDIYHQQITEGNILHNMDRTWDEIAYVQIGDNPGRKEPTTGEINYKNIFRHLHAKGWTGVLGMEHGNAKPGREGEAAVIAAYREVDDFLS